ncbi:hypothetical protein N24_3065 [Corynebacterium suranareeae]|uniref:Uncharacterized protein n=1 Tax=Corynebacterium suranareeae TaxID=2506452 RepID=A0A160PSP7_9CORY|nr:hypothetical protein [Corynebacterium suranareeae]BAU97327.1 hypothetical protein N24_3065 [Corynebacterium suranareeae]
MKKSKNSTTFVGMLAASALTLASISTAEARPLEPEHSVQAGTVNENA